MKVAVEGCCHGELDAIYKHIADLESRNKYKVDLLIICGDFQAIRNHQDLQCMAVPPKYRRLGEFYKYYIGEKVAPILTIVIGGNHEASNYMWELYHGGWLAPKIFFLGFAGCVQVNGIRIAGASGIYNGRDYIQSHWEKIPYDNSSMRSVYHIREFDVQRLSLLSTPNIFLSHDWPQGIEHHGNLDELLRRKPFFQEDIQSGSLGSPPLSRLLKKLKPEWWFSAHLHVRFAARFVHTSSETSGSASGPQRNGHIPSTASSSIIANPDEILIDDEDVEEDVRVVDKQTVILGSVETAKETRKSDALNNVLNPDEIVLDDEVENVLPSVEMAETKFLALDKCLPRRQFLEIIDVESKSTSTKSDDPNSSSVSLTYDPEWLAITRAFHPYLSTSRHQPPPLPKEDEAANLVEKELQWVLENVGESMEISNQQVFWPTAPGPGSEGSSKFMQPPWYTNPQTVAFCEMLKVENKINPVPPGVKVALPSAFKELAA